MSKPPPGTGLVNLGLFFFFLPKINFSVEILGSTVPSLSFSPCDSAMRLARINSACRPSSEISISGQESEILFLLCSEHVLDVLAARMPRSVPNVLSL